jgi:hypothetical protein
LDTGGRILSAVVRPYPAKTAGIPLRFEYEMNTGRFVFEWSNVSEDHKAVAQDKASVNSPPLSGHPSIQARETEIFIPATIMEGRKLIITGLGPEDKYVHDPQRQTLFVVTADVRPCQIHKLEVTLDPPLKPVFVVNDIWGDLLKGITGPKVMALVITVAAILFYFFSA